MEAVKNDLALALNSINNANGGGATQHISATELSAEDRLQRKTENDLALALDALRRFGEPEDMEAAAEAVRRIAGKAMARK